MKRCSQQIQNVYEILSDIVEKKYLKIKVQGIKRNKSILITALLAYWRSADVSY